MSLSGPFLFDPRAFWGDENVKMMTEPQVAAYLRLLSHQWEEGSIPSSPERIAVILTDGARSYTPERVEQEIWPALNECFERSPNDGERLVNARLDAERKSWIKDKKRLSKAGRAGGVASGKSRRSRRKSRNDRSTTVQRPSNDSRTIPNDSRSISSSSSCSLSPPSTAAMEADGRSARGAPPEAAAAESKDMQYFLQIEEHLNRERGATRRLDPEDYQLARRWRGEGVPLDLVRQAVSTVCAKHRERGDRDLIQTLRYCRSEVEKQWAGVEQLQAPGRRDDPPEPLDVTSRLAGVARLLPPDLPDRDRWSSEIEALEGREPEEVEQGLDRIDGAILTAASEALDDAEREALEAEATTAITAHVDRLPEREREAAKERIARRLLRKRIGLPRLSLFAPGVEEAA